MKRLQNQPIVYSCPVTSDVTIKVFCSVLGWVVRPIQVNEIIATELIEY